MFGGCYNLLEVDISNFNIDSLKDASLMFADNNSLIKVDVGNLQFGEIKDLSYMFYNCNNLYDIDISKFNLDDKYIVGKEGIFSGCELLYEKIELKCLTRPYYDMRDK